MTIKVEIERKSKKPSKSSSRKPKKDVGVNEKAPLLPKKIGHGGDFNGSSFTGGVLNLSTTIIGAGVMALPATMKVLGLGLGIVSIVFVAFLTEASINMLLKFGRHSSSYGSIMHDAFGNVGKKMLEAFVVINNVGVLIVYMIIIGDVLSGTSASGIHHAGVLEGWFGMQWWNGRFCILLASTLCVLAPLTCFKRIDSLSFTSGLAVALAIVFLVITAGITVVKCFDGSIAMPRLLPDIVDINSIWTLFTVVPVLVTAYICHFNGMEVKSSFVTPKHRVYHLLSSVSSLIMLVDLLYVALGVNLSTLVSIVVISLRSYF